MFYLNPFFSYKCHYKCNFSQNFTILFFDISPAGTSDTGLIFCRDPGIYANSFRRPSTLPTCDGFSSGSQLEYSCEQGFDLKGESSLNCLPSGEWTASPPRCVETTSNFCFWNYKKYLYFIHVKSKSHTSSRLRKKTFNRQTLL